jgi:hypothetical protein
MFHVKHFCKDPFAGSQRGLVGLSRSKAGRCLDGLVKPRANSSLPLYPNHLRLFGQKSIRDGGFQRLPDGFFMRRMGD